MLRFYTYVLIVLCCIVILCDSSFASIKQVIAGAGPSTKIVQLFIDSFGELPAAEGIEFEIPSKSSKHKGGIVSSDYNFFGRTGRPLNEQERKLNKDEIILARVPIAIVTGKKTGITKLNLAQLENIVTNRFTRWDEVGGPNEEIIVAGREEKEALFSVLKQDYSLYKDAKFKFIFKKDNHLVDFFQYNPAGQYAIGFGALPNFANVFEVNIVAIDGFESGVSMGLVYDLKNVDNPVVEAVKKYADSKEWKDIVVQNCLLPAN